VAGEEDLPPEEEDRGAGVEVKVAEVEVRASLHLVVEAEALLPRQALPQQLPPAVQRNIHLEETENQTDTETPVIVGIKIKTGTEIETTRIVTEGILDLHPGNHPHPIHHHPPLQEEIGDDLSFSSSLLFYPSIPLFLYRLG